MANREMKPRWKRVLDAEYEAIGEDIGRVYVDRYFDSSSKARMQEMVSNLKKAFRERIKNLTWMEPETKKKAQMKLDVLDVQVSYPDVQSIFRMYIENVLTTSELNILKGLKAIETVLELNDYPIEDNEAENTIPRQISLLSDQIKKIAKTNNKQSMLQCQSKKDPKNVEK